MATFDTTAAASAEPKKHSGLNRFIKRFLPNPLIKTLRRWRAFREFSAAPNQECDPSHLGDIFDLNRVFHCESAAAEWGRMSRQFDKLAITERAGGVNPGDRRALFFLVMALKPRRVLEVGTHIGASTIHIAGALVATGDGGCLDTVDIHDCNDPIVRPWIGNGSTYSPVDMVDRLGFQDSVHFHVQSSLDYLAETDQRYDLIFLDGKHTAAHVYQEIPVALRALAPGGYLLLHDYYPNGKPLWSDGHVGYGPYRAVERLRREGAAIRATPLGSLPWPTKQNSNVTSLALLST